MCSVERAATSLKPDTKVLCEQEVINVSPKVKGSKRSLRVSEILAGGTTLQRMLFSYDSVLLNGCVVSVLHAYSFSDGLSGNIVNIVL